MEFNKIFSVYDPPSKIEWDLTNGPRSVSCDPAIRYSGLGVRSVGPVGDFLENMQVSKYPYYQKYCCFYCHVGFPENIIYLEPVCPLFWEFNPPKEGLFQSKQGSFGFQV